MTSRVRALSAMLACLAIGLAACGEKEEPDPSQLAAPDTGVAPDGEGAAQGGADGADREPQPTEGRPVTTAEGAVRRAVTEAVGGDPVVGQVQVSGGRATAIARPRAGRYAGDRIEVVLRRTGTRWRVERTDPNIRPGS